MSVQTGDPGFAGERVTFTVAARVIVGFLFPVAGRFVFGTPDSITEDLPVRQSECSIMQSWGARLMER